MLGDVFGIIGPPFRQLQEFRVQISEESFGPNDALPAEKTHMHDDLESGMPIASGNTMTHSTGVQGLSERGEGDTLVDTNLPLSSGADLRNENSAVGVAGLQPRP
jgi:hypothetical protein